jgi:hypothetical protein
MGIDRTFEAITLQEVAGELVTDSYVALGSALADSVYVLYIFNTTNKLVYISEDGTNNHYRLPPGSSREIDLQANKADARVGAKPVGLQFYVKGIAGALPTSGDVWIEGQTV